MILAIDPGAERSAWVLYDADEGICGHGYHDNDHLVQELIGGLFQGVPGVIAVDAADTQLAVEMVSSFGMPVGKEVFETVVWIGQFVQAWIQAHPDAPAPQRITRIKVKQHLCNSHRAKDANIRQALLDKVGPQGNKKAPGPTYQIKGDEWSALAVAVTAAAETRNGTASVPWED